MRLIDSYPNQRIEYTRVSHMGRFRVSYLGRVVRRTRRCLVVRLNMGEGETVIRTVRPEKVEPR